MRFEDDCECVVLCTAAVNGQIGHMYIVKDNISPDYNNHLILFV